jgi:single-stranded DNA-binding protein
MSMTTVVTGMLVQDPEIRYSRQGVAETTLRIKSKESTISVITHGVLAENVALSMVKRMRIVVTGELTERVSEDEDGETRSRIELVAADAGASLLEATVDVVSRDTTTSLGVPS